MGKWDEFDPLYDEPREDKKKLKTNIKKVESGKMKKTKKDKMWIACCGCGKAVNIPETTTWIQDLETWISVCPYCGFKHKIQITKG